MHRPILVSTASFFQARCKEGNTRDARPNDHDRRARKVGIPDMVSRFVSARVGHGNQCSGSITVRQMERWIDKQK